MAQENQDRVLQAQQVSDKYKILKKEIAKVIVGQDDVIDQLLISLFSGGHALLIGVPGLAKTLLVNTLAESLGLKFSRIQFTPDLMPSDITGSEILDEKRQFTFIKGPVFSNVVLADEINRTPPKTQAALLEAMQEKSVTVAGKRMELPKPFFVLATQNPIEQEGTYPMPEAQLDRFMFNIFVDYPSEAEEMVIVKQTTGFLPKTINNVLSEKDIIEIRDLIRDVPIADNVVSYAVQLARKTRPNDPANELAQQYFSWGAGPRSGQHLVNGAKCHGLLHGKLSPDIEDVKAIALPVLRHRVLRNYKAEADGLSVDQLIRQLLYTS
ncbi:MAG: MoxR family ATPase [Cryomorphaceae bacterium]|nr:MoxR family ATPase [Cryomorphaceae bacterium]